MILNNDSEHHQKIISLAIEFFSNSKIEFSSLSISAKLNALTELDEYFIKIIRASKWPELDQFGLEPGSTKSDDPDLKKYFAQTYYFYEEKNC